MTRARSKQLYEHLERKLDRESRATSHLERAATMFASHSDIVNDISS